MEQRNHKFDITVRENILGMLQLLNISRVVVWGLKYPVHSHYWIHDGFNRTLKKIGVSTIWLDNNNKNNELLCAHDLVISADICMDQLVPNDALMYCLHNAPVSFTDKLNESRFVRLQVMTFEIHQAHKNPIDKFYGLSSINLEENCLYQSWGVSILPSEFSGPKSCEGQSNEFFVGSIWNNALGQGNAQIIRKYQKILNDYKIKFINVRSCPEFLNKYFVRYSAIGAAVVGEWQRDNGYTPCRLFKSVAYGRIGIINSEKTKYQYPWVVADSNIDCLVQSAIELNKKENNNILRQQQREVEKETYLCKIHNILRFLLIINEGK